MSARAGVKRYNVTVALIRKTRENRRCEILIQIAFYLKRKRKKSDSIYDKKPTPFEKSQKQKTTQKTPPKISITQRLRTVGRSVGVTIATQLVWLNWFAGSKPSHLPRLSCNQKDTFKN